MKIKGRGGIEKIDVTTFVLINKNLISFPNHPVQTTSVPFTSPALPVLPHWGRTCTGNLLLSGRTKQRHAKRGAVLDVARAAGRTAVRAIVRRPEVVAEHPQR